MDTQLLPPQAQPRREKKPIASPDEVAKSLWDWLKKEDFCGHLVLGENSIWKNQKQLL